MRVSHAKLKIRNCQGQRKKYNNTTVVLFKANSKKKLNKRQTTQFRKEEKIAIFHAKIIYRKTKMAKTDLYWGRRSKYKKHSKNNSTTTLTFSMPKKNRSKKDISKLTRFEDVEKMVILQGLQQGKVVKDGLFSGGR